MQNKVTLNSLLIFLFLGSFATISFTLFSIEFSLERVFLPSLSFFFLVAIFNNIDNFNVKKFDLILFILIELALVYFCIFSDNYYILYTRVALNCAFGFILYAVFINLNFNENSINILFFFILLSFFIYLSFSFSLETLSLGTKQQLAKDGFNPNAILNSLVLNMIVVGLICKPNNNYKFFSILLSIFSALQFSRQNLIASFFLVIESFRDKRYILIIIFSLLIALSIFSNLEIFLYLLKGYNIILGLEEATRVSWVFETFESVSKQPWLIHFNDPIDNTALTFILMYGLIPGLIILLFVSYGFLRLVLISIPLTLSLLTLFMLNDLLFEASFWFIFFSTLSSDGFIKIKEMSLRK